MGKKHSIEIICRKKGARLFYIRSTREATPYREMPQLQKQLFVLNVVDGGSWSKRMANIIKIPYRTINRTDNLKTTISIDMPIHLQNKMADIYLLNKQIGFKENLFKIFKRRLKSKEIFEVELKKGYQNYFIIIEPHSHQCLYNQVK